MAKIAKKKAHCPTARKRGGRTSAGEFSRVKIVAPAVRLKGRDAETIRSAVRNYYKRVKILEQV